MVCLFKSKLAWGTTLSMSWAIVCTFLLYRLTSFSTIPQWLHECTAVLLWLFLIDWYWNYWWTAVQLALYSTSAKWQITSFRFFSLEVCSWFKPQIIPGMDIFNRSIHKMYCLSSCRVTGSCDQSELTLGETWDRPYSYWRWFKHFLLFKIDEILFKCRTACNALTYLPQLSHKCILHGHGPFL